MRPASNSTSCCDSESRNRSQDLITKTPDWSPSNTGDVVTTVGDGNDETGVNGIGSSTVPLSVISSPSFLVPEKVFDLDRRDDGGENGVGFV